MSAVTPTGTTGAATGPHKPMQGQLDQSSFLRLMTTQLKTQDPFQPMDSQQMVAQMAQFSNVAGIAEMNATLKAIMARLDAGSSTIDPRSWIGRDVLIAGDFVAHGTDGNYRGQFTLDGPADRATVDLLDANGLIVHSQTFEPAAGTLSFDWDGQRLHALVGGTLKVRVTARRGDSNVPSTTNVWTPVQSVQSPAKSSDQRLITPNGQIAPDAAIRLG